MNILKYIVLVYIKNIDITNIGGQDIFTLRTLANSNKDKILLYIIINYLPFTGVFDYNNKLTDFTKENMGENYSLDNEHTEKT